jgi:hypothetical protein
VNLLLTIEGSGLIGLVAGLLIGLLIGQKRTGCIVLLIVPIAMIVYISYWQQQHPENLRSTSGLDFMFGPLWPSLGALIGLYVGRYLREKIIR